MPNLSLKERLVNAVQSCNRKGAAFAVVIVLLLGIGLYAWFMPHTVESPEVISEVVTEEMVTGPTLPEAEPMRIRIPEIDVDAPFEDALGIQANGEIEVPEGYESVGYYQHGPTPGELGPAVVLGHVDSYQGPAVFFRLGQLEEGDEILIDREDGTTATFKVTSLERHSQDGFPTAKVYSDLDYAGLRIITCSGTYDHGTLRYSHNLIVFAELVATSTAPAGE